MIQFTQLRLSGFKSFVEPTELEVEPGLTGVVGPNGCGKSNIVEALRWVMGESSAKQMRGGEMDDVIFAGTRHRPPRNVAEVTLTLDNSSRTAPAALNTADTLEVSRKINRGGGSTYRVNGKEVRARDVQLLFADAATGARSTAIVSQGKIGALINANPAQRRALLEEAAGISGLYSRRHEAELRLRGAENNLTRLDDVLLALDTQKQGLDKQAKQATRYRTLSEDIRALEIALTHRNYHDAQTALAEAREALKDAEALVNKTTETAAQASRQQFEAFAAVDPARDAANRANTELQRLTLARESLEQEERRLDRATRGNGERLAQIEQDIAQADQHHRDAAGRQGEILAEIDHIEIQLHNAPQALTEAEDRLTQANALREAAEEQLSQATAARATAEAAQKAAQQRLNDAKQAEARIRSRLQQLETDITKASGHLVPQDKLDAVELALSTAQADLSNALDARMGAEENRALCEKARGDMATAFAEVDGELRRLSAEIAALQSVLSGGSKAQSNDLPPILHQVRAQSGYEAALAVLLENVADAPLDHAELAPAQAWRNFPPLEARPAAPIGTMPLSDVVSGPSALDRRLSMAYLVDDPTLGDQLAPTLQPGQCLITKDGALWRWDGFVIRANAASAATSAATARLQQANHLRDLQAQLPELTARHDDAKARRDGVLLALKEAEADERSAREAVRHAESTAQHARQAHDRLQREHMEAQGRMQRLEESHQAVTLDFAEATATLAAADAALPDGDLDTLNASVSAAQANTATARSHAAETRAQRDNLQRDTAARQQRLEALRAEDLAWAERQTNAASHRSALDVRREAALEERQSLLARPATLAERRSSITHDLINAEQARKDTSDTLAVVESSLRAADTALKEAEQAAASAREDRVRAESTVERRDQTCQEVASRCRESLGCTISELNTDGIEKFLHMTTEEISARAERRHGERERLGPVNLRAEIEAEEVSKQIEALNSERDDLLSAIARLRQGIAELNREGKARLQQSFHTVNQAFKQIFEVLFGGGQAYLTLMESDDPLAAGIEIMASPPGKRMQMLSLLSGGEQALTALALLFAVFQSNPAPICILDEVDAPLDDANVDRFCNLLTEMANARDETGRHTRFLVVTHHRMTMARMDRLFGVTMVEQGVSQLVSVDLQTAETLREDPKDA